MVTPDCRTGTASTSHDCNCNLTACNCCHDDSYTPSCRSAGVSSVVWYITYERTASSEFTIDTIIKYKPPPFWVAWLNYVFIYLIILNSYIEKKARAPPDDC